MTIDIRPLSAVMGAEIIGADLSLNGEETFRIVHEAFLRFDGVVVVRDQRLTPEQHIAFSRRFGPLIGRRPSASDTVLLPGHPEILVLTNKKVDGKPLGLEGAGHYWHSDVTFETRPAMGSLLYAIEIPPTGGDTVFANMYKAYETLPDEIKAAIAGRRAAHSFAGSPDGYERGGKRGEVSEEQKARQRQRVSHPIVRTHPETRRKALYVNPGFTKAIDGLAEDESAQLLEQLFAHSINKALLYRHQWRVRDLLIWDNRCVIHRALPFDAQYPRYMNRTTVAGDEPY